jgi:hypothetical protein
MSPEEVSKEVVGLTKEEAIKTIRFCYGYSSRIVSDDNGQYMVTMDLRFNRINLYIENGLVVKTDVG